MRNFTHLPRLLIGAGFIFMMVLSPLAADEDGHKLSRKSFVNSMGMKMIGVKGGSFDAWTPSLARYGRMMGIDGHPDVAFALNRPRVTTPVTIGDYFLSTFPVTNAMYRQFVEETSHRRPKGKLVDFFWKRSRAAPWDLDDFKGDDVRTHGRRPCTGRFSRGL